MEHPHMTPVIRKKDMRWLLIIGRSYTPMYDGLRDDFLPSGPAMRLYKQGFIRRDFPDNSVHRCRWVLTDRGVAAFAASEPKP